MFLQDEMYTFKVRLVQSTFDIQNNTKGRHAVPIMGLSIFLSV